AAPVRSATATAGSLQPRLRLVAENQRAAAAPSTEAPATTMRLTARGRAVASGLLVLTAMVLAIMLGGWLGAQQRGTEALLGVDLVNVAPGDTLWGIAGGVAGPQDDVREVVYRIQELN